MTTKLSSVVSLYCNLFLLGPPMTKATFVQSSYKMMSDAVAQAPYYRNLWLRKADKISKQRNAGVFHECASWDAARRLQLLDDMKEDVRPFLSLAMPSSVRSHVYELIININKVEEQIRKETEFPSWCALS